MTQFPKTTFCFAAAILLFAIRPASTNAQDLFLQDQIGELVGLPVDDPVAMFAEFKIINGQRTGMLEVTATIVPHWHIFSMKSTNGPIPSKISVAESKEYKLIGKFKKL